jgi:RimJ/RimL family protein N-acetyltransferase
VNLEVFAGNEASQTVAARCGFTAEGTLQSMYVHRGVPVDAVSFSRIRSVARVPGGEPV